MREPGLPVGLLVVVIVLLLVAAHSLSSCTPREYNQDGEVVAPRECLL